MKENNLIVLAVKSAERGVSLLFSKNGCMPCLYPEDPSYPDLYFGMKFIFDSLILLFRSAKEISNPTNFSPVIPKCDSGRGNRFFSFEKKSSIFSRKWSESICALSKADFNLLLIFDNHLHLLSYSDEEIGPFHLYSDLVRFLKLIEDVLIHFDATSGQGDDSLISFRKISKKIFQLHKSEQLKKFKTLKSDIEQNAVKGATKKTCQLCRRYLTFIRFPFFRCERCDLFFSQIPCRCCGAEMLVETVDEFEGHLCSRCTRYFKTLKCA